MMNTTFFDIIPLGTIKLKTNCNKLFDVAINRRMPFCFLFSSFTSVKYFFAFYIDARALVLSCILDNLLQPNIANIRGR